MRALQGLLGETRWTQQKDVLNLAKLSTFLQNENKEEEVLYVQGNKARPKELLIKLPPKRLKARRSLF